MERKLASIRQIRDLQPIPGADAILVATVDDWQVVVKKNEFQIGDLCIYFEIDSFLPPQPQYEMLRRNSTKRMDGKEGFRLRTIKLRGQISQGFVIPVACLNDGTPFINAYTDDGVGALHVVKLSDDVTEILNIKKYETPIPSELSGNVSGNFPHFIKRTDQERCQNLRKEIFEDNKAARYEITTKLDGTSFTAFYVDGEEGVCSRNWELTIDEYNAGNSYIKMFMESGMQSALRQLGNNIAIQGELMGPGIQKNRESLNTAHLYVFDVYDITEMCYVTPYKRSTIIDELYALGMSTSMVSHVPILHNDVSLEELGITDVAGLLSFAEGPSIAHPIREGTVFKRVDGEFSFKAISNKFLLGEKDD